MADFHDAVLNQVDAILHSSLPTAEKLNGALRHLAKYRSVLVQLTLIGANGQQVLGGPFKGMKLANGSVEGCYVPKLLGCYEAELHPHILEARKRKYTAVINIGTAEGYYAIGMARLLPKCMVYTYDINEQAQLLCRELAQQNGVSDRMVIGGEFKGDDFEAFSRQRTLVICDIEGGEAALLDPQRFSALRKMDLIVELHDSSRGKCSEIVPARFAKTHDVTIVDRSARSLELPQVLDRMADLDRLLATWEWRIGPTPWAVMTAKRR